ncbi:unnamed protein product [Xylocopa violacea]|uniref:Protein TBRG4 n=1 Tax=Xylocopa violacea TaxID=135666 RepID=A0ABP1MYU4_XYLVO
MLHFNNTTVYTLATRITSRFLWRLNVSLSTNVAVESVNPNVKLDQLKETTLNVPKNEHHTFDDFKTNLCSNLSNAPHSVTTKIKEAENLHDLLEVIKLPLSPKDISKILEAISLWLYKNNKLRITNNKTSVEDIKETITNIDDISVYSDLSTSEMILRVSKLASTKNRNVQLLNYFFQNIIEYNKELNPRECSSLMFSMSTLSYSDERLLEKICSDLMSSTSMKAISNKTLTSIIKSMSFLRYKSKTFLDYICNTIINSQIEYETNQIIAILQSFATLGYYSQHINEIIMLHKQHLTFELLKPTEWLNVMWCYTVFRRLDSSQAMSVLDENFVRKLILTESTQTLTNQLKLLNINGYAQYAIENYKGPLLNNKLVPNVVKKHSKQKESYIKELENTLKNILPSPFYYNMNINTGMGFLLDAELYMNSDFKPVIMKNGNVPDKNCTKIGIMMADYYDFCLGMSDHNGLMKLYHHLLTCQKYNIVCLSYQNFGIEDKIERRVAYLKRQLWEKIKKSPQ